MRNEKKALIYFTRVPSPGMTKTRLMPYFTPDECAEFHTSVIKDNISEIRKTDAGLLVFYTGGTKEELSALKKLFPKKTAFYEQHGDTLFSRMKNAMQKAFQSGYGKCLLFGSDIPGISADCLNRAFSLLSESDVVLGPSEDGGYWLLGLSDFFDAPFCISPEDTDSVFALTAQAVKDAGLSIANADTLYDIDKREDLNRFRALLREEPALLNTASGRFAADCVRISVIIPVYNEEKTIRRLLSELLPYTSDKTVEIIIADGGSTDRTLSLIPEGFKVIHTKKGRGVQQNTAARQSSGDILFFLHADSLLPDDFLSEIRYVMTKSPYGCFGIRYNEKKAFLLMNSLYANRFRLKFQHTAFGDQGIFMTRELFFSVGGFPEIPIMEDLELSDRLRKLRIFPVLTKKRITTSPRRHPEKNFLLQVLSLSRYPLLRFLYRAGVSPEKLLRLYRDIR